MDPKKGHSLGKEPQDSNPPTCHNELLDRWHTNCTAERLLHWIAYRLSDRGIEMFCELAVHHEFKGIFKPFSEASSGEL